MPTEEETRKEKDEFAKETRIKVGPMTKEELRGKVKEVDEFVEKYMETLGKSPGAMEKELEAKGELPSTVVPPVVSARQVEKEEQDLALARVKMRQERGELVATEAHRERLKRRLRILPLGSAEARELRAQVRNLEGIARSQKEQVKLARATARGQRAQAKLFKAQARETRGRAREARGRAKVQRFRAGIVKEQLKRERLKTRAARKRPVRVKGHKRGRPKRQDFSFSFAGGGKARRRRRR